MWMFCIYIIFIRGHNEVIWLLDTHIDGIRKAERNREGDGGTVDIKESDYWLRQNGDVSTGFTWDGGIEEGREKYRED